MSAEARPVHRYHRAFGRSQFLSVRRLVKTAIDLSRLWVDLVIVRRHRPVQPVASRESLRRCPS